MIFLILISNIYNTTPNKQILMSYFFNKSKSKSKKDEISIIEIKENTKNYQSDDLNKDEVKDEKIKNRVFNENAENGSEYSSESIMENINTQCNLILYIYILIIKHRT